VKFGTPYAEHTV